MVLSFIESKISQINVSMKLFDYIVFSQSKYKNIEPLSKIKELWDNIETNFCFVDNRKQKYETNSSDVTIYYIECDTYKYYYTHNEIIKKMDYKIYNKLSKKIIHKYFKHIYKSKKIPENIPIKIHEFNSYYIFNLLNNYSFLT
jgi:hypothetical protein